MNRCDPLLGILTGALISNISLPDLSFQRQDCDEATGDVQARTHHPPHQGIRRFALPEKRWLACCLLAESSTDSSNWISNFPRQLAVMRGTSCHMAGLGQLPTSTLSLRPHCRQPPQHKGASQDYSFSHERDSKCFVDGRRPGPSPQPLESACYCQPSRARRC